MHGSGVALLTRPNIDGRRIDVSKRPGDAGCELYLELSGLRIESGVDRAFDPQRPARFFAHDRCRSDEVAARLARSVSTPADRRCLFPLESVREHLREVADDVLAGPVLDLACPLTDRFGIDAGAPDVDEEFPQRTGLRYGDALHQQVDMERAATLELDLYEPLDPRPASPCGFPELAQVIAALGPRQVLARSQNHPERRRVLQRVERQHLDRLDHVEHLAVAAQVCRVTAAGQQLARRVVQQSQIFRPALASLGPRVTNSLMQIKATLRARIADVLPATE